MGSELVGLIAAIFHLDPGLRRDDRML